ncbi:hypothetical protein D3C75_1141660 [compost metagenome]
MAKIGFGGTDQQIINVGEHFFHRQRFNLIVGFRTRAVRVDVIDLVRGDTCILHCFLHHLHGTAGARIGPGFVVGVAGGRIREDFPIQGGSPRNGVVILFQNNGSRALPDGHPGLPGKRRAGIGVHDV